MGISFTIPISHCRPEYPMSQVQVYPATWSVQFPSLMHGLEAHSSISDGDETGHCENAHQVLAAYHANCFQLTIFTCKASKTNQTWAVESIDKIRASPIIQAWFRSTFINIWIEKNNKKNHKIIIKWDIMNFHRLRGKSLHEIKVNEPYQVV